MKPKAQMEYRAIADLKELPGNPRTIKKDQFEKLKKSIQDNADYFKLDLKQTFVQKNGNSIKSSCDTNGFIGRNYSTRSKIPEMAIKDFLDQAIAYIEKEAA